jgi:hypothetical protein
MWRKINTVSTLIFFLLKVLTFVAWARVNWFRSLDHNLEFKRRLFTFFKSIAYSLVLKKVAWMSEAMQIQGADETICTANIV